MKLPAILSITVVLCTVSSNAALAVNLRDVLVSTKGTDNATCGLPAAPCRTIQYALQNIVLANGSVLIQDGAYWTGAIGITKPVSLVGTGGSVTIQVPNASSAVIVNAGAAAKVILKGLTIEGTGVGLNGIDVRSSASLDIIDCVVRNFSRYGVLLEPSTVMQYNILNTTVVDNGYAGIYVAPSGGSAKGSIINSDVSRNRGGYGGITFDGSAGTALGYVQDTRSNFNTGDGFSKVTGGTFTISNVSATGNGNNIGSYGGGGPGYSYKNNFLTGNVSDSGAGFLTAVTAQ